MVLVGEVVGDEGKVWVVEGVIEIKPHRVERVERVGTVEDGLTMRSVEYTIWGPDNNQPRRC